MNTRPRTALYLSDIQSGFCIDQVPVPTDWQNEATLTTYKTGTNVPTEVHEIRLREGEYIEATILPGGEIGEYDTRILTFGVLPIQEQHIHEYILEHDELPYHPEGAYFTKIGSCDNRGAERLWQFMLFPEVQNGLTDDSGSQGYGTLIDAHGHGHEDAEGNDLSVVEDLTTTE